MSEGFFDRLPIELVNEIYEYDNTYKEKYDFILKELMVFVSLKNSYTKTLNGMKERLKQQYFEYCLEQDDELNDAYNILWVLEDRNYISGYAIDEIRENIQDEIKEEYGRDEYVDYIDEKYDRFK